MPPPRPGLLGKKGGVGGERLAALGFPHHPAWLSLPPAPCFPRTPGTLATPRALIPPPLPHLEAWGSTCFCLPLKSPLCCLLSTAVRTPEAATVRSTNSGCGKQKAYEIQVRRQ